MYMDKKFHFFSLKHAKFHLVVIDIRGRLELETQAQSTG